MLYEYTDTVIPIEPEHIDPTHFTVGFMSLSELKNQPEMMGLSRADIEACEQKNRNVRGRLNAYDDYSFGIISVLDIRDTDAEEDRIGLLLKKNMLVVVDVIDRDKSTTALFTTAIKKYKPESMTIGRLTYAFFAAIMENDLSVLDEYETKIDRLERQVVDRTADNGFSERIFLMRQQLLDLRNYYEQLVSIGRELEANENDLFTESDLRYFGMVTDKANRLMNTVQLLRESLVQVREAYSMSMDNRMNKTMQLFTVITVIFLPLTLIVGWYGMNFKYMPELNWEYGYLTVIAVAVAIAVGCILFFKKKKFF